MKRLCILLCILILLLCGCSKQKTLETLPASAAAEKASEKTSEKPDLANKLEDAEPEASVEPEPEPELEPVPEPQPVYDDSILMECFDLRGTYTDELGNPYEYVLLMPQILDHTEGAKAINQELQDVVGDRIRQEINSMSTGVSLVMYNCTWESIWHENVLTLIIQMDAWGSDYYVCHYDAASGQRLTNAMVLEGRGVDPEGYLRCLRATAEQEFLDQWGQREGKDDFYPEVYQHMMSEDNLNLDTWMYYDETDTLYVIPEIGSLAGAMTYPHILPLDWSQY